MKIGDFPFCPHSRGTSYTDLIDYTDEMIADEPRHFTSRRERRKYMDSHGIDFKDKFERPVGSTLYWDMKR